LVFSILILAILVKSLPGPECTYYYLSPEGSDQFGNGTQMDPWQTLNYTLTQATPGDVIVFEPGVYDGPQNIVDVNVRSLNFQSQNVSNRAVLSCGDNYDLSLNINAGYVFIMDLDFSGCKTMITLAQNQITLYNVTFSNIQNPLALYGETSAIIDYCEFINTDTPVNTDTLINGSVTILNSVFTNSGPIVSGAGATVSIATSIFSECNTVEGDAGCILNNGILLIDNTTFVDSVQSTTENGGAIWSGSGSVTLANSVFTGNSATDNGGALYLSNTVATVVNCTFSNNSAQGYGGAIALSNSALTASGSYFLNNNAGKNGGAFGCINNDNSIILNNCIQSGNEPVSSCPSMS